MFIFTLMNNSVDIIKIFIDTLTIKDKDVENNVVLNNDIIILTIENLDPLMFINVYKIFNEIFGECLKHAGEKVIYEIKEPYILENTNNIENLIKSTLSVNKYNL